mmetsp:Transcript_10288/g.25864  ORF Transcript_10288/g.25864 Transcript_10288/m.25864 type:complete len:973 (+) Transcript_10288:422-3340(+)|eukprot:CAMPEP_0177655792 /NCGR_PEP_ID=MMETSP0447-20121125/15178_1 /TAXON_ID=0 /ORGANISM="Stygamoeba regulata, Strain BSH-02190019" /LENGTH=972 /DNA_ID=CAMNT_0019159779 /DNA_START=35 /DNA_END=2953 /DNA_ORIENTATION=+
MDPLHQDLINVAMLLTTLDATQLAHACRFVGHDQPTLLLSFLRSFLASVSPSHLAGLIALAQTRPLRGPGSSFAVSGSAYDGGGPPPFSPGVGFLGGAHAHPASGQLSFSGLELPPGPSSSTAGAASGGAAQEVLDPEQVETFITVFRLTQLRELILQLLSPSQLDGLLEAVPRVEHNQRLQMLLQLQQFFARQMPETLLAVQQEMDDFRGHSMDEQLLQLAQRIDVAEGQFALCKTLWRLILMYGQDLTAVASCLPKLDQLQMQLLVRLTFLDPLDLAALRHLLEGNHATMVQIGPSSASSMTTAAAGAIDAAGSLHHELRSSDPFDTQSALSSSDGDSCSDSDAVQLSLVEQPPERLVYKRNVKPHPTVMLLGDPTGLDGNFYVVPVLVRCDSDQVLQDKLLGAAPQRISPGRVVAFKKIKVLLTSHQTDDTLFAIRFQLRLYSDRASSGAPHKMVNWIDSNPMLVLSHSTQLRPTFPVPIVKEVVPLCGTSCGGTRVAILGDEFADSPTTKVRFDRFDTIPIFHGPGTLICLTPQHEPGTVMVKVTNNGRCWSDTHAVFTYEGSSFDKDGVSITTSSMGKNRDQMDPFASSTWSSETRLEGAGSFFDASSLSALRGLDTGGYSVLHRSAATGNVPLISEIVSRIQVPINIADRRGNSPLHWAVVYGHVAAAQELLRLGANPLQVNEDGDSPIHLAAQVDDPALLDTLLASAPAGAVYAPSLEGSTPLHLACTNVNSQLVLRRLMKLCRHFDQRDDEDETPLHYAIRVGSAKAAELLLRGGASANVTSADGETPLHLAATLGEIDCCKLLLRAKAQLNIQDQLGRTALHEATISGNVDIVSMLVTGGSPLKATDAAYLSAVQWAALTGKTEVLQAFLDPLEDNPAASSVSEPKTAETADPCPKKMPVPTPQALAALLVHTDLKTLSSAALLGLSPLSTPTDPKSKNENEAAAPLPLLSPIPLFFTNHITV